MGNYDGDQSEVIVLKMLWLVEGVKRLGETVSKTAYRPPIDLRSSLQRELTTPCLDNANSEGTQRENSQTQL